MKTAFERLILEVAEQAVHQGFQNYIGETHTVTAEGQRFDITFTVQAEGCRTPQDHNMELLAEVESLKAQLAQKVCAHEWIDDGGFIQVCTNCGKEENHEPYGWVQTRGDAINHFTQEWEVVEEWTEKGFEWAELFKSDEVAE